MQGATDARRPPAGGVPLMVRGLVVGVAATVLPLGLQALTSPAAAATQVVSVERVNLAPDGSQLSQAEYYQPVDLSRDGTHVVFEHFHPGLVPGDTTGWDVFARDTTTGVTKRISVTATGGAPDMDSYGGAVNGDGSQVVFASGAFGLKDGYSCSGRVCGGAVTLDVYVRDRDRDRDGVLDEPGDATTVMASRSAAPGTVGGTDGNGPSGTDNGNVPAGLTVARCQHRRERTHGRVHIACQQPGAGGHEQLLRHLHPRP